MRNYFIFEQYFDTLSMCFDVYNKNYYSKSSSFMEKSIFKMYYVNTTLYYVVATNFQSDIVYGGQSVLFECIGIE